MLIGCFDLCNTPLSSCSTVKHAKAEPCPRLSLTALAGPGLERPARLPHCGVFVPNRELHTQVSDNKGHVHVFRKSNLLVFEILPIWVALLGKLTHPFPLLGKLVSRLETLLKVSLRLLSLAWDHVRGSETYCLLFRLSPHHHRPAASFSPQVLDSECEVSGSKAFLSMARSLDTFDHCLCNTVMTAAHYKDVYIDIISQNSPDHPKFWVNLLYCFHGVGV